MSFQQVSIKNFRAIESLEMDNIKQVNLLTGKNNCGKTSVLEAIFLLAGMSNPHLAVIVHNLRGLVLNDDKDFSYLFHKFDFSRHPSVVGKLKSQKRQLDIEPDYSDSTGTVEQVRELDEPVGNKSLSSTGIPMDVPGGLTFYFTVDGRPFHTKVKIPRASPERVGIQFASGYKESLRASFTNPMTIMTSLYPRLEAVLIRKELGGAIDVLREIEPDLQDIKLGVEGMIYADIAGIERLTPIHLMGDGIIKILALLTAILEMRDGVLLIDEIENGLHYSALVPLWKAIFKMASASNVQLFIATHSYECIDAMADVYRESGMGEDFISLFRIEQDEGGRHYAVQYKASTLLVGIERNFEVR
uniref:ATPase/GTPase, AAA15 family n=1 Tax=Candidatus Kentrum sp. FW TaxID=2126338 RepID=A0A450RU68_9GAMM|nr:MAG: ATPase/GTPase, AAA15 family [Candidatus Kentron sp. FW]